ncbi:hypothetical protein DFR29_1014 [Tahibacter aquaticus]|uniref:LVIVD repeat-containing protein n=1 Tax=Tahibacter aquaticus TaxID=520092 RepID=A0A4V6PYH8_9GAMM|nr:hypothetical protein [Tahibacter aquaticus]TDR48386.1 hypothetical protein DFR29_1014 [Tahibacter aquaticus]
MKKYFCRFLSGITSCGTRPRQKYLALASSLAFAAAAAAEAPGPMVFDSLQGGTVGTPAAAESYFYVPTGRTITAWYSDTAGAITPGGDTRTAPAAGSIGSLVRRGDYLYADYGAGVAVYSIANRAQPLLLGQYDDFSAETSRRIARMLLAADHLYLVDPRYGVYASPLADPAHPKFVNVLGPGAAASDYSLEAQGSRLYAVGNNDLGDTQMSIYDLSAPLAPQLLGRKNFDCCSFGSTRVQGSYGYVFGDPFRVLDLSNPASIQVQTELAQAFDARPLMLDGYAWNVGDSRIDVLDLANPAQPSLLGSVPLDLYQLRRVERIGPHIVAATQSNRLLRLEPAQPAAPQISGTALLPAAASAQDLLVRDDRILLGEPGGLGLVRTGRLDRLGFQPLPAGSSYYVVNAMAAEGNRAYLLSANDGVKVMDIADPAQAVALGFHAGPANSLAVRGNVVYLGRRSTLPATQGTLDIVDMSDPSAPQLRSSLPLPTASSLVLHGNLLFAGVSGGASWNGGLRIVDISNPAAPALLGSYESCSRAHTVALDRHARVAALACDNGVELVDVQNPASPALLQRIPTGGDTRALVRRGNRIYFSSGSTIQEADLTDPLNPVTLRTLAQSGADRLRIGSDARLYGLADGIAVFQLDQLFADGLE